MQPRTLSVLLPGYQCEDEGTQGLQQAFGTFFTALEKLLNLAFAMLSGTVGTVHPDSWNLEQFVHQSALQCGA